MRRPRLNASTASAGAPAAWLVVVLAVDLVTDPSFVPAVLYGIAPLISSALLSPRVTAAFAAAALALTTSSVVAANDWGTTEAWIPMGDVALVGVVAVLLAVARVRREAKLARLVRIAEMAQRAVLPLVPRRIGSLTASARYVSATEDSLVGGDLYDWFQSDRRICFIVADVRGKGLGAVEQAARVIRAFRQSAASVADPAQMATAMSRYLGPFLDDEEFATAVILQVVGRDRVTFVSCGHPLPLLVTGQDGAKLVPLPPGLPLGLGERYAAVTIPWAAGDRLLLYTDGLSEARNATGEFFPVEPLGDLVRKAPFAVALDEVLRQVRHHVPDGQFSDDLALVLLENSGDSGHRPDWRAIDQVVGARDRPRGGPGQPAG